MGWEAFIREFLELKSGAMQACRVCCRPVSHGGRQICAYRNMFGGAWVNKLRENRAQMTKQL